MSWLIAFGSMCMLLLAMHTEHPMENETLSMVVNILLSVAHTISLCIASEFEDKLKRRIEVLEKKLEDIERW